jgi:two-component system, NarL family, invasion response regulator UvrY
MIRVLIVDDHSYVRRGLREILSGEVDMTVVGEAANAEEMLTFIRTRPCDIVLTDISMPGWSGLEALKEVKLKRPAPPVLVLSVYPEEQYGPRTLRLGAAGYLTKDSPPETLIEAIRKAVAGETRQPNPRRAVGGGFGHPTRKPAPRPAFPPRTPSPVSDRRRAIPHGDH